MGEILSGSNNIYSQVIPAELRCILIFRVVGRVTIGAVAIIRPSTLEVLEKTHVRIAVRPERAGPCYQQVLLGLEELHQLLDVSTVKAHAFRPVGERFLDVSGDPYHYVEILHGGGCDLLLDIIVGRGIPRCPAVLNLLCDMQAVHRYAGTDEGFHHQ